MQRILRIAQIIYLRPEAIEPYKKCHAEVWPEVLQQIKDCNIRNCELKEIGVLYIKTADLQLCRQIVFSNIC